MGYYKDFIKGVSWMAALRSITRGLALIKIIILARLLSPFQFGLFGIASLVLSLLETLTETGVNVLLVQEKEGLDKYLNTAWVISIVRGVTISLMLLILAFPVSKFFRTPESAVILLLISVIPLISGFINPSEIKFQKNLEFHKEFIFRMIIFISDMVVSIVLAFVYHSATSIVWGMLTGVVLEVVISFIYINPKPVFKLNTLIFKKAFSRGKWITLSGIFNYIFENIDDIIVGKLINTYSLGLYQMAYKISALPVSEGGEVIHKVTFPFYVKIAKDKKRLRNAFLKVVTIISLIAIPYGLVLVIFSHQIISVILGREWVEIVLAVRVLAVLGVLRAIFGSSSSLFLAVKKQEYITVVTLSAICILAITIVPLVNKLGIFGAGLSALLGWIIAIPVVIFYLIKQFKTI